MKTKQLLTGMLIVALALCATATWAQQKDPRVTQPTPPAQPITTGESSSRTAADGSAEAAAPAPQQTKQPPLSSAQPWSLGLLGGGRSYFVPTLTVGLLADTNSGLANNGGTVGVVGQVSGRVRLQHVWADSQLQADYGVGSEFYSRNADYNALAHSFGVSYGHTAGRWGFYFSDNGSYAKQTRGTFSNLGMTMPGTTQLGGGGNEFYNPSQSILTTRAGRISNFVLGEARYQAGRRSSFTFSGGFGLVHFLDAGFIDARTETFSAGYNYSLSAKNTLGVSYSANLLRFDGDQPGVDSHSVFLNYGRFLTGRLSWQLGGGAFVSSFGDPAGGSRSMISWTVRNAIQYRMARNNLSMIYTRGVTEGSGIYAGAVTQSVQGAVGRQLSRMWGGNFGVGYNRNERLQTANASGTAINSWFVQTSLGRPIGRYARMNFLYNLQRQVGAGQTIGFRHVFGISFDFKFRPFEIE